MSKKRAKTKPSQAVLNCVLGEMTWSIDLPKFLKEVKESDPHGAYQSVWNILVNLLEILTQRAIELDDPALHLIMLKLGLYDSAHSEEINNIVQTLREKVRKDVLL